MRGAERRHIQSGKKRVVDVELEKLFPRVNHDVLMSRIVTKKQKGPRHHFARGGQHGHAMQDWLQAEAELGLGKQ